MSFTVIRQLFPPKPKWWQKDMPDLTGKVIIVTGAKTGIGKETVMALLQHNAKVYLAARGKEETRKVIEELKQKTGKEAIFLELDLANLASVRTSAEEFLSKESELHILFNNAGLMIPPMSLLTKDGYDAQWGVHVVGTHLFTKILMPALIAGAQTSKDGKARIVTVASTGAYMGKIHWDTFEDGPARTKLGQHGLYNQSKLAQVAWTRELARRYGDKNILCLSLNPGNITTDLQRNWPSLVFFIVKTFIMYPVDPYGSLTSLYAGTSPDVLDKNGAFLIPFARIGPVPPDAMKPELGAKLWEYLEKEVEGR